MFVLAVTLVDRIILLRLFYRFFIRLRHNTHVLQNFKHVMTLYDTTSIIFNMKTGLKKVFLDVCQKL